MLWLARRRNAAALLGNQAEKFGSPFGLELVG